jgi:hypothetical protein
MYLVALKLFFGSVFGGIGKAISAVFTFFTATTVGRILLAVLLVALLLWQVDSRAFKRGVDVTNAAATLAQAKAETAAYKAGAVDQANMDAKIQALAEKAAAAREAALQKTVANLKRITTYVTPETDRLFPVPCGLYRLLHAAEDDDADPASVNLPAGLSDEDACPIAPSDLAENGLAVIGQYHDLEAQVAELQALARALKEAAEK